MTEHHVPRDSGSQVRRPWVRLRVGIAVTLVLIAAVAAASSYWYEPLRVCRVDGASERCLPWGIVELVPFMLVALLLLLPDIGEISVSNLFTLKRRIDAQESEIRSTIDRQEVFQRQVLTHISSVANNQQVTQNFYQPLSQSAAELPKAIRAKESPDERLRNGSQSGINDEFKSSRIKLDDEFYLTDYGPDDAVRALRLIDEWEYFSFYIDPPLPYRTVVTTRESVSGEIRSAIWSKYRDEIDVVRSVRNSIAHARYVPPEDLRGALEAVQELNRILRVPTHELLGVSPEEFERRIREG